MEKKNTFRFERLEIWREAVTYVKNIYLVVKTFPREELFALSDQLKRSAVSIPSNIAEGSGRRSNKDFCHYLDISIKSIFETVSHLYIARELGYITEEKRIKLYEEADIVVRRIKTYQQWLNNN